MDKRKSYVTNIKNNLIYVYIDTLRYIINNNLQQ